MTQGKPTERRVNSVGRKLVNGMSVICWYGQKARVDEYRLIASLFSRAQRLDVGELRAIDRAARCSLPPAVNDQTKVLCLIVAGMEDALEIAAFTGIPPKTVSGHISHLLAKGLVEKHGEIRLNRKRKMFALYRAASFCAGK